MFRPKAGSLHRFLLLVLTSTLLLSFPIAIRASWFPPGPMFVDGEGPDDVGVFTSLVVVNGHPAISYYDFGNDNLKYARATDTTGTSWISTTVDSSGDVQGYTSMQVLSTTPPVPAISYRSSSVWGEALTYARATDIDGTNWVTTTVVEGSGEAYWNTSLAIVAGHPAIGYYDPSINAMRYVRANDTTGSSWGAPVTVDSVAITDWDISLAVIAGYPAMSYYDYSSDSLRYARANDATGSSWGTPVTAGSSGGGFISMTTVNGRPAIGYYDHGDLKYVRANDTTGSSWDTPVIVDDSGDVGVDASLAIVNGNPAISYLDQDYYDLMYIRATDVNGAVWGPSIAIDTDSEVGGFTSLAVVAGNPAISYYDYTNTALKYVRANDPNALTIEKVEAPPVLETMEGWLRALALFAVGATGLLVLRRHLTR